MNWNKLKEIADDDSITTEVNPDNGIVSVKFAINGGEVEAQFSTQNSGIFAFTFWNSTNLLKALKAE